MLRINFTFASLPVKMNTTADFSSRSEQEDANENVIPKIREDIPTKPIDVNIGSTGIAQEEPVFLDTTEQHETTEKNFGNVKMKHEMSYQEIHQSSHCLDNTQTTYTKTLQF